MEMVNGYVFLDLTKSNVYSKALKVLGTDKPVVIKDGGGSPYFVDSLTLDGTNVVITKGGKTITIANDNTITSVGSVENALMENIKDSAGNPRFIEGDLEVETISGLTINYAKWSLSGTHLMVVISGEIENGTEISTQVIAKAEVPEYVLDKIVPTIGNVIYTQQLISYASDYTTQNIRTNFSKGATYLNIVASVTATADRVFRGQYDLLIDADYSE